MVNGLNGFLCCVRSIAPDATVKDAVYELAGICEKANDEKIEEALSLVHERFAELNQPLR